MQVLALDCAQRFCSAALYDAGSGHVRAALSPDIGRGHAERLPGVVEEVLSAAGATLSDIDRIAVTIGPGSFAGIRVGVAFARGLALALRIPAVGVSSLAAIGEPVARRENRAVLVALDARRDRLWAAVIAPDGSAIDAAIEADPADVAARLSRHGYPLVGNAGAVLRAVSPDLFASATIAEIPCDAPDIGCVAAIGARLDPPANPAEPAYLRSPDAKPQAGFAIARSQPGLAV